GGSVNVSSGGGGGILLSPNPADNILTVEINKSKTPDNLNNTDSKTSELRIYDKMMNLKMKKAFKGTKTKINVRNLKQGVYILQIISGNKNFKKEIIVSHH
ncbi:MAG: T9SS type A sorting domain-containing protein, partial [Bacteroidales bacterium]|nr:T9SS type A sorting domain-containing protein [Bacteroidales bacterium]